MQMAVFRDFSRIALPLIALTLVSFAAGSETTESSQGMLMYSAKSSSQPGSVLLKSPRGAVYRVSLIPEFDVGNHAVVLDLVLQEIGKRKKGLNLLDSRGKLHGYQPYFFAASDFTHGAQNSEYGILRVIDLQKLGIELLVTVFDVHVESTTATSLGAPRYRFGDLTLQIRTESRAETR
jgi:hypothetical protein